MVRLASLNHPDKSFRQVDFMNYKSSSLQSASISEDHEGTANSLTPTSNTNNDEKFGTILFNECMHYFLNTEESVKYASNLIKSKGMPLYI